MLTYLVNIYGGKATQERIYPDDYITDEYGRTIELVYPATAIINRTVGGLIWEVLLSSFGDKLQYLVQKDLITPERAFEFVEKFHSILGCSDEFNYSKFTPQSLYEFLKIDFMRIILKPYSNNISLETAEKLIKLGEEYIGYGKSKIFVGFGDDKIETTSLHTVGRLFTFRDVHDCEYGNSSCSVVEKNTKGFANHKDSSKRDGRALNSKKSGKMDVQNQHIGINVATNADINLILNGKNGEAQYSIIECMNGAGIGIGFRSEDGEEED